MAGFAHKGDNHTQQDEKNNDIGVASNLFAHNGEGGFKCVQHVETGKKQCAGDNANKQGYVDFFCILLPTNQ